MPKSALKRARQASRKVFHLETAFEQIKLQIETQHDVQVVRHLVGIGADQRALDLVDGAIEGFERHLSEMIGEGVT